MKDRQRRGPDKKNEHWTMGKGKATGFLLLLLLISSHTNLHSQERGVQVPVETLEGSYTVGKQCLVVIAVDKYKRWMPLKNPVKDSIEIRDILVSRYYIDEVYELYNEEATKSNIMKLFVDLQKKLTVDDSLMVIYSGHGYLDKNTNTGFWIPVDAETDVYSQVNWLPHSQLRGLIANMNAMHICVIADSCFSGDILNVSRSGMPTINQEYFKRAYSRVSRQVLTSGASEIVPDRSDFARQLKLTLRKNKNPYLDTLMLFNEIRLGVSTTMPMLGTLNGTGHQEGASFLLFLKEAVKVVRPQPVVKVVRGSLKIAVQSGGKLYIDGVFIRDIEKGVVDVENIEPGEHSVMVEYRTGKTHEEEIKVDPGSSTSVVFSWKKEPVKELLRRSTDNYFTIGLGFGLFFPVAETADVWDMGYNPTSQVNYNIALNWGHIGLGLLTGVSLQSTNENIGFGYDMLSFPIALNLRYLTAFSSAVVFSADVSAGAMINRVTFKDNAVGDITTTKPFLAPTVGVGMRLGERFLLTMYGSYMMIFFDENATTGIIPGARLEFTI